MSHHLTKADCATFILKDTQCAGLCREDCKLHGDALAANGVFQNYMSMHQAVASRLRRGRQNRPIRLCGCSKSEKEKGTFKTHELYGPPLLDAGCRLRILPAAMLCRRISATVPENADRSQMGFTFSPSTVTALGLLNNPSRTSIARSLSPRMV